MKIYSRQPKDQPFLPGMKRLRVRPTRGEWGEKWVPGKIRHVSNEVHRCRWSRMERVFAEQWMKKNREQDILQVLFSRDDRSSAFSYRAPHLKINYRDARVAATVVQWMGTGIGSGFVIRCLELCGYEIKKVPSLRDAYYRGLGDTTHAGAWHNFMALNDRYPKIAPVDEMILPKTRVMSLPSLRDQLLSYIAERNARVLGHWRRFNGRLGVSNPKQLTKKEVIAHGSKKARI